MVCLQEADYKSLMSVGLLNRQEDSLEMGKAKEEDRIYEQIGRRLYAYRSRSGMTLRDVSEATGLSPSYLSKLESGKVGVSVVNLDKIVTAIGLSGIELVMSETDPEDSSSWLTRADHRTRVVVDAGVMYEEVTPRIPKFGLSAALFRCQPGYNSGEMTTHKGDEFRYVVKGRFRFCMADEEFVLHAGDTISHPSSVPHCWENIGSEEGIFLVVSTLPPIDL